MGLTPARRMTHGGPRDHKPVWFKHGGCWRRAAVNRLGVILVDGTAVLQLWAGPRTTPRAMLSFLHDVHFKTFRDELCQRAECFLLWHDMHEVKRVLRSGQITHFGYAAIKGRPCFKAWRSRQSLKIDPDAFMAMGMGEPTPKDDDGSCNPGLLAGDKCHINVVDRWGNMVSAISSGGWMESRLSSFSLTSARGPDYG